jgi:hypothetical protein
MGIQLPNVFSLGGKLKPLRLLGDARFERAFHCVTRKIVGALLFSFGREDAHFYGAQFRQSLEVSSIDWNMRHAVDYSSIDLK